MVTPSSAKVDQALRKQIRSYVMRGRNRKRLLDKDVKMGSWVNDQAQHSQNSESMLGLRADARQGVPITVGTDMALIPFAEYMKPYMLELVFQWFNVLKQSMYPVEVCVQFEVAPVDWQQCMAKDKAYVHSGTAVSDATIAIIMTLCMVADAMGDPEAAKKHINGLHKIVTLRGGLGALRHNYTLQLKVCRADLGYAVNTGTKSLFFADGVSWDSYIQVASRDGISSMGRTIGKQNPIENGTNTDIKEPWDPSCQSHDPFSPYTTPSPESPVCPQPNPDKIILDYRLVNIWTDLQEWTRATNIAFQTGFKIDGRVFQEIAVSAQYRLVHLGYDNRHSSQETLLRSGMLAFTITTFLKINGVAVKYEALAQSIRGTLLSPSFLADAEQTGARGGRSAAFLRLKLWYLFVAYVSVLDGAEDEAVLVHRVRETLSALGLCQRSVSVSPSWPEVRDILREHIYLLSRNYRMVVLKTLTTLLPLAITALSKPIKPTAPFALAPSTPTSYTPIRGSGIKVCSDPDFQNTTTAASPLAADCSRIAYNIREPGDWRFESFTQHQLVQYQTCAFGVQTEGLPWGIIMRIGNQDIIDAIDGAVQRFVANGLLGAAGNMNCSDELVIYGAADVVWGLYHTK
ncbi:putative necrosis-inducing factor-domain-containing protein [Podospora appendiculata]|uniref:Necrosis-inducing factor-domain-containing protein n=1 Tax=Podospora appendiculata TaxID=314037 RepID=A0AAE0X3A2_9PEZI|nr:putative necrosis-inducing factor-domain-containing protein [Podospora appendiculata]